MKPKITVLIPTLTRNHLLRHSLSSLLRERPKNVEIIVLDDSSKPDDECKTVANEFECLYIHSGHTKSKDEGWRIPGFAFNIGAKLAHGKHLILSSAEAYHPDNTLKLMLAKVKKKTILITRSVRDDRGEFLRQLDRGNSPDQSFIQKMKQLNAALPFFMSVPRDIFIEIGGYDEDFTGVCWDDNDIVNRLVNYGCKREVVNTDIIHLFHPRHNYRSPDIRKRWLYNRHLFNTRKNKLIRNEDRRWGEIDLPTEDLKTKPSPTQTESSAQTDSVWGYKDPYKY